MKRTLLFVFLVSSLFTAAQAQTPIVNGDFENWINDIDIEPAVWQTNNNYFSHVDTPDVYVISRFRCGEQCHTYRNAKQPGRLSLSGIYDQRPNL
jgi:hypothetical protein